MARIQQISPDAATEPASRLLDEVKGKLGFVPNMTRAMANSPAVLEGYLKLSASLAKGRLSAKVREQIGLAVAQANECSYCLAAHAAIGRMVGLTAEQINDSRLGNAVDLKSDSLVRFALKTLDAHGAVRDSDLEELRTAGFDDGVIAEVVANVALHVFTNYFNRMAETDLDFPALPSVVAETATAN